MVATYASRLQLPAGDDRSGGGQRTIGRCRSDAGPSSTTSATRSWSAATWRAGSASSTAQADRAQGRGGARPRSARRWLPQQSQLAVLDAEKREEEARLMQARANLRLARNDLANTVIRAPIAGVAGNRAGQVGQYVKPGTQLLSLVPLPRGVCHRQFQGNPADPYAARPEGRRSRSMPTPISRLRAASRASRRRAGPSSACCRRTTRPEISPRSSSACRCASPCRPTDPLARKLRPGLSVTVTVDTHDGSRGEAVAGGAPIVGAAQTGPPGSGASAT